MEFFCENSLRLKAVNYFYEKASLLMFYWALNTPLKFTDNTAHYEKPFYPANVSLYKVNNRNIRKRCEVRSKLTIKTLERSQRHRSGVFNVNF